MFRVDMYFNELVSMLL